MLSILGDIFDKAGHLSAVSYSLFEGDPKFITAVELNFGSYSTVFRAVADDDTISVSLGSLKPSNEESLVLVGNSVPWLDCLGSRISWLWLFTNQQGYRDGVRLEFNKGKAGIDSTTIELIVVASAIELYTTAALRN